MQFFIKVVIGVLLILLMLYMFVISNKNTYNESPHDSHKDGSDTNNICRGYLTDKEYLEHMIPHHQVAVDISVEMQKKTKWPVMQEILRKLIWTQKYEIAYMNKLLLSINYENGMSHSDGMNKKYIPSVGDYIFPNKKDLTNTYCDPHFFDPEKHMEHIKEMNLTDEMYIHHMVPHHQVAVDMSKVLLTNTNNDHMIYLAYRIIRSQQAEIILLHQLLNTYKSSSHLLN